MTAYREPIEIAAQAIVGSRAVVAIPVQNPSMGPTLEVVGLAELGLLLTLTDPAGAQIWQVMLVGLGADTESPAWPR